MKGIRSGSESAFAPIVIGDPSYFPDLVRSAGRVGRGIALLKGPIRKCVEGSDKEVDKSGTAVVHTSAQIIVLGS